jgi:uncharacterized protein (DUF2384 family)
MARIATPQAGDRIENFFSIMGPEMYAFRTDDQARMFLEEPVARERHPVRLKVR